MTTSYAFFSPPAGVHSDLTNPSHFEQFVTSYSGVVLTVCLRLLKDRFAAEDACQETFVAAWRHRNELRPNRAWLLKVATNKCLDELRWRSRHRAHLAGDNEAEDETAHVVSPAPSPEAIALTVQAEEMLQAAVSQLPWAQQVAVVLSDVEGWSYKDIASACDVSMGTVKSRIFRARRSLRERLDEAAFFG